MTDDKHWHLDRRVPVAFIFVLAVQTGGFAYWLGGLSERVAGMERTLQSRESEIARLARIEARLEFLKEQIAGLKK